MLTKGFRIKNISDLRLNKNISEIVDIDICYMPYTTEMFTGTFDRNNTPIFEGDTLRSKTCETPFKVENIVDFLMMCGAYREKNGCDIFESLEIVKEEK